MPDSLPRSSRRRPPKRKQMCPNAECERFQQPTTMLGGCSCGSALVPFYVPPTDEQLENFVRVIMRGQAERLGLSGGLAVEWAVEMTMRDPEKKALWLKRHREFQDEVLAA